MWLAEILYGLVAVADRDSNPPAEGMLPADWRSPGYAEEIAALLRGP